MSKTIYSTDINESTIVYEALNNTLQSLTSLKGREQPLLLLGAFFLQNFAAGENQTLLLRVTLQRQSSNNLTNIYLKIFYKTKINLRCRDESAQTLNSGNDTAFNDICNLSFNGLLSLGDPLKNFPCGKLISLNLGENRTILTTHGYDKNLNHITDLDNILCGFRGRIAQFTLRNGNFLLVANIYKCLVTIYQYDGTFDDFLFFDFLPCCRFLFSQELFHCHFFLHFS